MNRKGFTNILLVILAIIIVGGIAGYFVFFQKPPSPPATSTPQNSNTSQKLTLEVLKNAQYYSPYLRTSIKLTDGVNPSLSEQAEGMVDSYTYLDNDFIVFGDLNNDGQEDAAVILVTRDVGPVGMTSELAVVVNQNGIPFNITTKELGKTEIHSLKISSGVISVDMTPWIISEGMVRGQGTRMTINYKLSGNELVEF